jgi:hypothetical protein
LPGQFAPVLKASTLFALLAALMLVIAGTPASASASACNPCPPDCPMMAQMEMGMSSADQGHQPDQGGKGDNPCKQGLACASAAVAAPLAQDIAAYAPLAEIVALYASGDVGGPTHPPDPGLRPPIQL